MVLSSERRAGALLSCAEIEHGLFYIGALLNGGIAGLVVRTLVVTGILSQFLRAGLTSREERGRASTLDRQYRLTLLSLHVIIGEVIISFKDRDTEKVFQRAFVKAFSKALHRTALRKLLILDAAEKLDDLRIPPGNRLESLSGHRKGQHSIRINDQWRICFRWLGSDAEDVEITDYH